MKIPYFRIYMQQLSQDFETTPKKQNKFLHILNLQVILILVNILLLLKRSNNCKERKNH